MQKAHRDVDSFQCIDSGDAKGLLVDLGIGYFDHSGDHDDGAMAYDMDIHDFSEIESELEA